MRVHLTPEQARNFRRVLALAKKFLSAQGTRPDEAVVNLQVSDELSVEVPSPDVAYRSSVAFERVEDLDTETWQVPAQILTQIVNGEGIILTLDRAAGFLIAHRGVSRWQLALYKGASVPTVERGPEVYREVDGEEVAYALDHVRFCVGDEDSRPYLRALDCQKGRVRACDGAMYTHYDMKDKIDFSIPGHVVDAVRSYLKDFTSNASKDGIGFGETENAYHFSTGVDSVSIAKPSFEYPDLNTIIVRRVREDIPCVLKVSPLELSNALSNVAVVSDKNDTKLEISIQRDKLTLKCAKRGGTEAVTSLEAQWANPDRTAYFDVKRFRDLLNSVVSGGSEWEVKFGKDVRTRKSPIVIEGTNTWTMLNQVRPL